MTFPLVPHHAQRARRGLVEAEGAYDHEGDRISHRRLSDNGPEQMGSLYQGYGTHYVDLWCGSPPQRQTVIVDTGSSQTAFPCGDCRDCGSPDYHVGKVFEEAISESFESFDCDGCSQRSTCNTDNDRCEIEQYYSEGSSWTAYEARDTCFIGGFHNTALLEVSLGFWLCLVRTVLFWGSCAACLVSPWLGILRASLFSHLSKSISYPAVFCVLFLGQRRNRGHRPRPRTGLWFPS